MRLALLADIHGNSEALRAVLAHLDGQGGADRLLVLGDIALAGPAPEEVVALLAEREAVAVCGNVDRFLLDTAWEHFQPADEEQQADQELCLWALERLGDRGQAWLRGLPGQQQLELCGQLMLLVHGSPRFVTDLVLPDTPEEALHEMMEGVAVDLVLSGHTHTPLDRWLGGKRLLNPGAVGIPSGQGGTARYALLTADGEWPVEFHVVPYEVERTIERLLAARRPYRLWVVESLRRAGYVPSTTLE
jgi:putative phosphoesterase